MKRLLISLVLLAVILPSCKREGPVGPEPPAEKDVRIELSLTADSFRGLWKAGDKVSVLDPSGNHEFTASEDGETATFIGEAFEKADSRIVISPYLADAAYNLDSVLVSIPAVQRGFEPVSAGVTSGGAVQMKAVGSAISFSIQAKDVSRIDISGRGNEDLAGKARLSFLPGDSSVRAAWRPGSKTLTLLPKEGENVLAAGSYQLSCIPASCPSGLNISLTKASGAEDLQYTDPCLMTEGRAMDIGALDSLDPVPTGDAVPQDPERTEAFDIELVFLATPDGTNFTWPFASPSISSISTSFSAGKASFPGQKTTLVLPEEAGGYTFQVYATTGVARNSGGHQGFKFGGAVGDYLQFPAIKGLCLTKVTWVAGGSSVVELVRYDDAPVLGGGSIPGGSSLAQGATYTWTLYGSKKETAYKIRTGSTGAAQAQKILLHYDVNALNSDDDPSTEFQEVLPDEIPDFSRVGYRWGDKAIPDVPVKMTLEAPADGSDAFNLIQNAINTVETPGTILLKAGTYNISDILKITRSGVVLRGEGEDKTILYSTATTQQSMLLQMGGTDRFSIGTPSLIIAKYVPVGQLWVPVRDPEMFSVGERVWIYRPATEAWLDALHMRELASLYSGATDWTPAAYSICWERKIMKIEGNKVWLDNPVVMCIGGDESYGEGYLCKGSWPRIEECGIENLTLDTRFDESKKSGNDFIDEEHCWSGITVYAAEHSWIRNVTTKHFGLSSVSLATGSKNITVKNCTALSPVSIVEGGKRYAFSLDKSQLSLVEDCFCDNDRHQFVTGAQVPGPNVFLRCTSTNARADAGPHQRWATGVLYDNVKVSGAFYIQDRAGYGTGHGWPGANFVCYNCETSTICVQSPWVTGQNWAIGCTGIKVRSVRSYSDNLGLRPDGIWESPGTHVSPESLYESQLAERHARGEIIDN